MPSRTLSILKLMVVILMTVLALIAILYVLDIFAADHLRIAVRKIIAIMAIVMGASLITLWLTGSQPSR